MKKEKLNNLDLDIYKETLDNGLEVYICPMDRNSAHASIITKYGNDILDFKPIEKQKYITIPTGTAHFFEHKMFAKEDGPDPMSVFAANGAYGNAYTSSKITRYYFTGQTKFYENLQTLLDCITKPYFTKENIQKEQGIINQEINAGNDDPQHAIYFTALKGIFKNHPHQYPVFGYPETIKKLTSEILYDVYNTFYHPSNMFMIITGKVVPKETIEYIKNYFKNIKYPKTEKIQTKMYQESEEVTCKKQVIQMSITNTILNISYKIKTKYDKFKSRVYLMIYLNAIFGPLSDFYEENFKDKNALSDPSFYIESVDEYIIIHFQIELKDYKETPKKIDKIINSKTTDPEMFELYIKNTLNDLILTTENVSNMADFLINQMTEYETIDTKIYNKYKKLTYEEYNEYINTLNFKNKTISIIKNKT